VRFIDHNQKPVLDSIGFWCSHRAVARRRKVQVVVRELPPKAPAAPPPLAARLACRGGSLTGSTAGVAPGLRARHLAGAPRLRRQDLSALGHRSERPRAEDEKATLGFRCVNHAARCEDRYAR
jgi:hypothetical protein